MSNPRAHSWNRKTDFRCVSHTRVKYELQIAEQDPSTLLLQYGSADKKSLKRIWGSTFAKSQEIRLEKWGSNCDPIANNSYLKVRNNSQNKYDYS